MLRIIKFTLVWAFQLFIGIQELSAQKITNSGKDFWFAFTEMFDKSSAVYWVNITSNDSAKGTVSIPGVAWTQNYSINPGQVAEVRIPSNFATILGSDTTVNRAIHITSDNEVVVFAVSYHAFRHEASIVLPTIVEGKRYRVMSYQSEIKGNTLYESEFNIVSTGDTVIYKVTPSADIAGGRTANVSYIDTLLPNEVYQAQADSSHDDLAGTLIESINDKPFAVYSGNVWSTVVCRPNSDPLMEAMYPTNSWGSNYFTIPTPSVNKDYVKMVADQDTTIIFKDGVLVDTLNAGEFYDDTITTVHQYTSSKPMALGHFLVTGQNGCSQNSNTDPSMIMLNATEQMYLDSITFFAVDTNAIDSHFVHVITRTVDTSLMFLNATQMVGWIPFTQDTKYAYRTERIKPGNHRLETRGCGFIAYSMGIGPAVSYGYAAGVSLVDLSNSIQFTNAINGSDTICLGDTVQFKSVSFANALSFSWDFGDGNTDTLENPTHGYATNGTYVVSLTTVYSCATVTTKDTVEVPPTPIVNLGPDTTLCNGDSLTFSINTHVFKAFWSDSSTQQFLTVSDPGKYWVEVSNFCGADTDSVTVQIITADSLFAGKDSIICQYSPIILGGNPTSPGNPKFKWTPSLDLDFDTVPNATLTPSNAGQVSYIVAATHEKGCVVKDTVSFKILSGAKVDAGPDKIICDDTTTSIRLGGNPTGSPSSKYVWGPASELINSNSANPTTKSGFTRVYYLLVQDTSGCTNTDSVIVSRFGFQSSNKNINCGGDSAQLEVKDVLGVMPIKYLWKPNYALTSDTIANPIGFPDSTINYTVIVTDSLGCIDSTIVTVAVSDKVKADFDLLIKSRCEDATITTFNKSTNAATYNWYYNGSSYSSDKDFRVNVDFTTSNLFKLIVKSNDLCVDSLEKSAVINEIEDFKGEAMPNVFTPNSDGINDLLDFNLGNDLSQCSQVFVYNRWGVLVYESTKGFPIWDGRTFTGEEVVSGVYFYRLTIHDKDFQGHVTLVR